MKEWRKVIFVTDRALVNIRKSELLFAKINPKKNYEYQVKILRPKTFVIRFKEKK